MIAFINDHREAYGIEPICKVLPIALSTYHAHIAQRIDPSKRSARAQRDEALKIEVRRVFEENFRVYGRKSSSVQSSPTELRSSDRKLKPLPPNPLRHQDSAIAPSSRAWGVPGSFDHRIG